jgi:hypothetical protein
MQYNHFISDLGDLFGFGWICASEPASLENCSETFRARTKGFVAKF